MAVADLSLAYGWPVEYVWDSISPRMATFLMDRASASEARRGAQLVAAVHTGQAKQAHDAYIDAAKRGIQEAPVTVEQGQDKLMELAQFVGAPKNTLRRMRLDKMLRMANAGKLANG